jgi:diaminohydroxyphosphoribosylaminopyrimidine deaminase/5-amino-6-(5-phosphoribosylamino)uracil reductase
MQRCLQLAAMGAGYVAPNPMVGAVLVHKERIIGEGYHQKYGEAHAEVNCIASVKNQDRELIGSSVLYVSLEPCAHFGKTPPCADLIIKNRIPQVVIGCRDPFKEVDGRGIEKLRKAGIDIETGVLEAECKEINKRFFTFNVKQRPYIILKWAETVNGKIAVVSPPQPNLEGPFVQRLHISNEFTNRLVHKWRSEDAGIMVGTNTALADDPELTTRWWNGPSPIRLIIDMDLRLPPSLKIFNDKAPAVIFNKLKQNENDWPRYYRLSEDTKIVGQLVKALYHLNIQSVMIEGGAKLLQSFIDEQAWNEARIITNSKLLIENGLAAPLLTGAEQVSSCTLSGDIITTFKPAAL